MSGMMKTYKMSHHKVLPSVIFLSPTYSATSHFSVQRDPPLTVQFCTSLCHDCQARHSASLTRRQLLHYEVFSLGKKKKELSFTTLFLMIIIELSRTNIIGLILFFLDITNVCVTWNTLIPFICILLHLQWLF